ncbi:hypothetical protein JAAARDRAFT_712747 [Jaapia argillacea MUCL 33604]|uniref:Transmembrane protein n=1 Tax=Jaapia argillacea MUCL 33604 TaxID=933084 RepID=A0A067PG47_9AGAM|nr:hypothetical protein JAAARDRAFT_712747 [Jaapia argillacea MUCL 33604]
MDSVFRFARSFLLIASVLSLRAVGQADNVARCNVTSTISQNLLGQDDCAIATALRGICLGDFTPLTPLPFGYVYREPEPAYNTVNNCTCSSVYYTMFSACAWCQGGDWEMYNEWIGNCSTPLQSIGFPGKLLPGTSIPHWAYTDPRGTGGTFNASTAVLVGDIPETTATPSPTSTTSSRTSTTSSATSSSSSSSSTPSSVVGAKKSHTGAIVGGVVAGVVVIAIAVIGLVWYILHRRNRDPVPTTNYPGYPATPSTIQQPLTPPATFENSAFYDPNRPIASYPSYPGSPVQTTYSQSPPPGPVRHPGLPEVYNA